MSVKRKIVPIIEMFKRSTQQHFAVSDLNWELELFSIEICVAGWAQCFPPKGNFCVLFGSHGRFFQGICLGDGEYIVGYLVSKIWREINSSRNFHNIHA